MSTCCTAGTLLEVRGERWLLTRAAPFGNFTLLTLEGRDRSNLSRRLRVIEPFDRARPVARRRIARRSRRTVIKGALATIHAARPPSGLWTAASATIDLWPYQLEPALAAIGGATRLLLADAVGLGKTIQAGLLLSELRERGWVERALIVCPAGLRDTWARELRERFAIDAAVLDQAAIAERVAALPTGVNPWSGHAVAIASIDFVKRAEVIAAIEREPIDLLIADEAHHLAPGTDRGDAVGRLASSAPWCVLVSATPHSGDQAAFDYLTNIGSTGDPIAIFRRARHDVGLPASRRCHLLGVTPTADEAALLTAIDRYAKAIWHARGHEDRAIRLVAVTLARRAASSAAAIARTLRRRLDLLSSPAAEPMQSFLPWDDEDVADDVEDDGVLAAPGLPSLADERSAIEVLLALAERCATSSKVRRIQRLLRRIGEPAVVFTEYRDSLDAVARSLAGSRRVVAIHGGVPVDLRRAAIDAFNHGDADVLIATDTAGEGVNLHHRCRLVIDLELPWNPLRLEQRVGRVDRLGQRHTVHALRLFHPHTIEHLVRDHLQLRQRRAQSALAESVTEGDVASAIFEGRRLTRSPQPRIPTTAIARADGEVCRIRDQRKAQSLGSPASRVWAAPRNRRPSPLVVVNRVVFSNVAHTIVGEEVDAQLISLRMTRHSRRDWRQVIDGIALRLNQPSSSAMAARIAAVDAERAAARASLGQRIAKIRQHIARDRAVACQRSLFDGRADADAAARERITTALDGHISRTLQRATAALEPDGVIVEFVAAWPAHPP